MNKKIIVVGKLYQYNMNNGPGNVMHCLVQAFHKIGLSVETIWLNESTSPVMVIVQLIKKVLFCKNKIINVHTDGFMLTYLAYLISKVNKKNTYYLTVHGLYNIESKIHRNENKKYSYLEKKVYTKFDNLICVSEMLKKDIEKIYGRTARVHVIGNGTDALDYPILPKEKDINNQINFIMAGGINQRKGILEAVDFIHLLVNTAPKNIHLDIYGKIENDTVYKQYRNLLKQYDLSDTIVYHGMCTDKKQLYEEYSKADFQLCLSRYDTFNVAVIESMAFGCPAIVSINCGAKDYIIDGKNGFLLGEKENGLLELGTKLTNITQQTYLDLCKNAFLTGSSLRWDNIAQQYKDLFGL